MKYWRYADIPDWNDYKDKLSKYCIEKYSEKQTFWNPLVIEQLKLDVPEFINSITNVYGDINEISILVSHYDNVNLHIDHKAGPNKFVQARINFPILNTEGTLTCFFDMEEKVYKAHTVNNYGTIAWPIFVKKALRNTAVESVCVNVPTILKTDHPHTVYCDTNNFPRMALTVSFKEDVVKYLD